jgi:hypothetical protein
MYQSYRVYFVGGKLTVDTNTKIEVSNFFCTGGRYFVYYDSSTDCYVKVEDGVPTTYYQCSGAMHWHERYEIFDFGIPIGQDSQTHSLPVQLILFGML